MPHHIHTHGRSHNWHSDRLSDRHIFFQFSCRLLVKAATQRVASRPFSLRMTDGAIPQGKHILTSRVTFAFLIASIVVLTIFEASPRPNGRIGKRDRSMSPQELQEYVHRHFQREDQLARNRLKNVRDDDEVEAAVARRQLGLDDGGDDIGAQAPAGGDRDDGDATIASSSGSPQHVHIHLIAIGDSLTEGVVRKHGTTKLLYSPYSHIVKEVLTSNASSALAGGDRIVSVTTQVFGFKGKTAGGVFYSTSSRLFKSDEERSQLIPAAIPADVQSVFLNHVDSDGGGKQVDRVVMVCAVMAGTNDLLRAEGSTVSDQPPLPTSNTTENIFKIHQLCADYARAIAKRSLPADSSLYVQLLLLPIALPPVMLAHTSRVVRKINATMNEKKNPRLRSSYGYCLTEPPSADAMMRQRSKLNDIITSPGRFIERLEQLTQSMRLEDGGEAVGKGDIAFAAAMFGKASKAKPQVTSVPSKRKKPIVSLVSKEVVQFDSLFSDDVALWSDCLHMTHLGYEIIGKHVAHCIRQQI